MKNIESANVLESFFPKNFYIRVFERARKGKIQNGAPKCATFRWKIVVGK